VAIVAGHYSTTQPGNAATISDPGAVCSDGLKEVDINLPVAQKTLALLARMGYPGTLFEEFDSRLKDPALGKTPDFRARAFLSIHSDSCVTGPNYPVATGWKVAHAEPSDVPEADDRLVRCIRQGYSTVVKPYRLSFSDNTITPNMTGYHGFRSIVPTTPAAIIELGFMSQDREILTRHQDELAQGLANGLQAFLQNQPCTLP
jgi:N-acetylmuramoyl-L-alanine amidase